MTPQTATPAQILAFRLATQGVTDRAADPLGAFGGWAVQDSPPSGALYAALARSTAALHPGWLDDAIADRSVVALYNPRTATAVLPAKDAATFGTAFLPEDDDGYGAILGRAVPEQKTDFAEPVELAVEAISDALDGRALSRDDLHEELRHRLPKALLPWCDGCQSHHARRGLLVMASLRGRLCISGRVGRQPEFSRTDQWATWKAPSAAKARKALVEHYLGSFGPSTPTAFADWSGLSKRHAKAVWATAQDDLGEVDVDGSAAWILTRDADALADPPDLEGIRLIGPGDPLLQAKDRAVLLDDVKATKRVWSSIPTTGVVLHDGTAVGTWKAKKAGQKLAITATALGRRKPKLADEAERLAAARGATGASVAWK